jgi:hypothetical protein
MGLLRHSTLSGLSLYKRVSRLAQSSGRMRLRIVSAAAKFRVRHQSPGLFGAMSANGTMLGPNRQSGNHGRYIPMASFREQSQTERTLASPF